MNPDPKREDPPFDPECLTIETEPPPPPDSFDDVNGFKGESPEDTDVAGGLLKRARVRP